MKIAFLTLFSLREWGGVENWIFNMAQLLSKNHEVAVISNGLTVKKRVEQIPEHDFRYYEIPTVALTFLKPSIILSQVPSWLKEFDVLYLYHNSLLYSLQTLTTCKPPTILGIHSELVLSSTSGTFGNINRRIFNLVSTKATKIVCRSKNQVDFLHDAIGIDNEKIKLERPFVNTNTFQRSKTKDHFTALFVGRFVKGKGIPTLQKAIRDTRTRARWIFVGNGEMLYETTLDNMSKQFSSVFKKGFLRGKDLTTEFAKASVLVNPSESESLPNVVLQSLACGTPVILSDIPAHREIANMLPLGTYSLFQRGNSKELADEVLKWENLVNNDTRRYNQICFEARCFIEKNFSETEAVKSFENLLYEVTEMEK